MSDPKTIQKIKATVERKFVYYPKTQEVLDLKEELLSIILDKYNDLTEGSEKQKYQESMSVMMASYKQVLHDLEIKTSRSIFKDKMLGFSLFATTYFMVTVIIYFLVSFFVTHSFKNTYYIVVAPSIVFLFITSLFMLLYCNKMKFEHLTRVCLGLVFLASVGIFYVIPNLFLNIYYSLHYWHPTWLIILVIGYIYLVVDKLKYPHHTKKGRLIRNCLNQLAFSTMLYLVISVLFGYWHLTWLIFVLCVCTCEINIFLYFKNKI